MAQFRYGFDNNEPNRIKLESRNFHRTFKGDHNSKITWNHLPPGKPPDWEGDFIRKTDWAVRPVGRPVQHG